LLQFSEIKGVNFSAWKSGSVNFFDKSHVWAPLMNIKICYLRTGTVFLLPQQNEAFFKVIGAGRESLMGEYLLFEVYFDFLVSSWSHIWQKAIQLFLVAILADYLHNDVHNSSKLPWNTSWVNFFCVQKVVYPTNWNSTLWWECWK